MENELSSVPTSESNVPPVAPVAGGVGEPPSASLSSRKTLLIGVGIFLAVAIGFYFLVGGGGSGLKGSFIEDNSSPLSGEAAPAAITGEAAAKSASDASGGAKSEADEKSAGSEKTDSDSKGVTQVAVKSITAADASVKTGGSTVLTFTGKNLFSMTIAVSGTALTFTGTNIILTIPAGAAVSYSDLSIAGDGASATVKATIGASAVPGEYGVSYFDIGVSDKALGIIPKVLTVE